MRVDLLDVGPLAAASRLIGRRVAVARGAPFATGVAQCRIAPFAYVRISGMVARCAIRAPGAGQVHVAQDQPRAAAHRGGDAGLSRRLCVACFDEEALDDGGAVDARGGQPRLSVVRRLHHRPILTVSIALEAAAAEYTDAVFDDDAVG